MSNRPLISIVTVNYNQTDVTCALLTSLQEITYPNIEIIVVDNGSAPSCAGLIARKFPHVRLIESPANLGFAGGNNLGLQQARGEFFMLLNNDTEVSPFFLDPLVKAMQQHPEVGVCAAKLRFYDQPDRIQFAGSTPIHPLRMASNAIGYGLKDEGQFDKPGYTHLAHGAAMLVRRKAVQKAGLMPEEYFLYYEELDWCERIKKAGYRIFFVPDSVVFHKESVSIGKATAFQVYYKTRNRILLARRWRHGIGRFLTLSYLSAVIIRDMLHYTYIGKPTQRIGCWEAVKWHFEHR